MAFTKCCYDENTFKTKLNESIGPGLYSLERLAPCNPCGNSLYAGGGPILNGYGDAICDKELIDVDSELLNITRKLSDCPADKYIPKKEPFCKVKFPASNGKNCNFLLTEPTLISNPKCTGREVGVNRFEWLCKDPQSNSLITFDWNINNRLITKINHRPLIERPLDQSPALPPKCNDYIKYDWASRYNQYVYTPPSLQLATCKNIPDL